MRRAVERRRSDVEEAADSARLVVELAGVVSHVGDLAEGS